MKKSDIYICGFMYLFSFFFLYLTLDFPEPAIHYPYFVIGLLLLLTTVRMSHLFRDYRREHKVINDSAEVFDGFLPKQFWIMFAAFLLFFLLMYLFGFYIASIVYIFICLRFFRIKMKYIFLVLICMAALIYGTFDVFLNVPLPDGIIMEEFL